jgi:hypothetical protein
MMTNVTKRRVQTIIQLKQGRLQSPYAPDVISRKFYRFFAGEHLTGIFVQNKSRIWLVPATVKGRPDKGQFRLQLAEPLLQGSAEILLGSLFSRLWCGIKARCD